MAHNRVIIVTTRDYPCDLRSGYQYIDIPGVNSLIDSISLDDKRYTRVLQDQLDDFRERIEKDPAPFKRLLVWNDGKASWCRNPAFFSVIKNEGFHLVMFELIDKDEGIHYYIFIGPCTNGNLPFDFNLKYTKEIVLSALEKMEKDKNDYERVIVVAHDSDIDVKKGSGLVSRSIWGDFNSIPAGRIGVLKFQHEDSDKIWKLIVGPIRDNNLSSTNCSTLFSMIEDGKDSTAVFSSCYDNKTVATSYLSKIDKSLLISHYPDLITE